MPNSKNVCFGIVFLHVILTKQKQYYYDTKKNTNIWIDYPSTKALCVFFFF